MKYIFVFVLSVFLLFETGSKVIKAQNPTREEFNKAYAEYRLKYEEYDSVHSDYVLAKSQYEKFKTLTSRTNAQAATAKMLQKRDDVVVYYLAALKIRLKDTSIEITEDKKNSLYSQIDDEINWFNNHKSGISESDSLTDLINKSNEAKSKFTDLNYLIYDSLFSISDGRMVKYEGRFKDFLGQLSDLINKIKGEKRQEYKFSDEKIQTIDRWIIETEDGVNKAEGELSNARDSASKMATGFNNAVIYNGVVATLTKSGNYLKDAISYTKEIVREIKVAED